MSKIFVTANQILNSGYWKEYCDKHQINPWCINEGLMDADEELEISLKDAIFWGIVKVD